MESSPTNNDESFVEITSWPTMDFPRVEIERNQDDTYVESDPTTLTSFIYPSNVVRRNYQFEITQECFHQNTLVCLPTGTGKTLIAAVAMANFHRWFPKGKIIFMATTRNLVNQQVSSCYSFTNIPHDHITIIMGNSASKTRKAIWDKYSIFFCTPQIVQNDIRKKRLDPTKIILLVFDEAHHAKGNHSYSQVVRMVAAHTSQFRIIGLSATPGNDISSIQSVIYNLMISKIIYKDTEDPELKQYQNKTDVEIVTVPLGNEESILTKCLGKCISSLASQLQSKGYLTTSNPKSLTRGAVWVAMNNYQKYSTNPKDKYICIEMFGILLSLASMYEKLTKYGTEIFNDSLNDFIKKKKDTEIKRKLLITPEFQALIKATQKHKNISHPKLFKLIEILEDFYQNNTQSRSIIFTQFRAVAYEIVEQLKNVPNIKPSIFIGKTNTRKNEGLNDSTQLEIVSLFRRGSINCIVATSVGEEGLDIGEVDLIICYDTPSSPLKTVQRMGRTGRKRSGKVIFLMAEGYEEKELNKAKITSNFIKSKLINPENNNFVFYEPEIPNIPLTRDLNVINLRCGNTEQNRSLYKFGITKVKTTSNLQRNESHALECCFGDKLKYDRIELNNEHIVSNQTFIISHSNESNIFETIQMNSLNCGDENEIDKILMEYSDGDEPQVKKDSQYFLSSDSDSDLFNDDELEDESDSFISKPKITNINIVNNTQQNPFVIANSSDDEKFLSDESDFDEGELRSFLNENEEESEVQNAKGIQTNAFGTPLSSPDLIKPNANRSISRLFNTPLQSPFLDDVEFDDVEVV
ncbi:Type III restriction enzyme, res subunit family protein [Histomonas meleagridis]|uniref:Type III restriction enzyme, res subunit family protein n=1 Tax=Histomonas meleagridis TaxID=135588 RepID=UPI003559BBDC|nr:Type III restriction enzyme, res subunit family protein [Histomonas meleagridis]KAH0803371.1 Type III restriction enzyme, res subunit family protein [Histomonas meleagridis]